jgi:hypothetical protein
MWEVKTDAGKAHSISHKIALRLQFDRLDLSLITHDEGFF